MARVELPQSRLKARKRRRRVRLLLAAVVLLVLCAAAAVGLSYLPALLVTEVRVAGAQTLSTSTIQAFVRERIAGSYALMFPKRNIFLYPKKDINAELLASYPVLASADVHAGDFHTIAVNVVERTPRALWCVESRCYFMDENGVVYGDAPTFSEPVYVSYFGTSTGASLPKQFLSPVAFQALAALVDAVAQKLPDETIGSVTIDDSKDVRVRFASGFELVFGLEDQAGDVFERFALALTSQPLAEHTLSDFDYLDLRFGDKLYYKLK
jgi:cell division septal protein FtsQ